MKALLFFIFLGSIEFCFSQTYISPIGFVENEFNKQQVISFIKKQVKTDLQAVNMDSPQLLRMMEEEQLDSFKKLLKVTDLRLLKRTEKDLCAVNMCNYQMIWLMYEENYEASKKSLEW